ncbi:MAG: glutamate--tRNA ligase [Candidatus Zixiibacteriota bacterium]|nr:MAG: glutamate--tRNA ligase [candidate division Zixibacteria bacterium]
MTSNPVKVRIAPSPTGYLHVGTARTAIFNYLFAKHNAGEFVVRIEDTDLERSKPELIDPILSALKWLGLEWDGEIVFQSKRSELYADYLQKFIQTGQAYYCFCSQEELKAAREKAKAEKKPLMYNRKCLGLSADEVQARIKAGEKPVVRVKIPDGGTSFDDMVSGRITRQNEEIEDFIIARSDGSVTYNFAVVVDDHDMGITHVIRGNDHVTNTFKQIIVYEAFGFDLPRFGHVPLILRPDKKKVSKRLGDKDVNEYQGEGILPEAMVNYLSLLGWSPKTDRDIYTTEELVTIFNDANFNASNAVFDEEKLLAFNQEHIQKKSDHDLAVMVAPMLVEADLTTKYWLETRWEYLRSVIHLLKGRAQRVSDIVTRGAYFFSFDYVYDEKAAAKHFSEESAGYLEELAQRFEALGQFTTDALEAELSRLAEEKDVKKGKIIHPTRLAVSGGSVGPGLFDLLATLGQSIVVERMRKAVDYIRNKS